MGPLIWMALAQAADPSQCEIPSDRRSLGLSLQSAVAEVQNLDPKKFRATLVQLHNAMDCLTEPAPIPLLAQIHEMEAILAFLDRQQEQAAAYLREAHALDPSLSLRELLPEGHPLIEIQDQAAKLPSGKLVVAEREDLRWFLNGSEPIRWSKGRAGLVQVITEDGDILYNIWLEPGEALPDLSGIVPSTRRGGYARIFAGGSHALSNVLDVDDSFSLNHIQLSAGLRGSKSNFGLVLSASIHNGLDYYNQIDTFGRVTIPGDAFLLNLGVEYRRPIEIGSYLLLTPGIQAGGVWMNSPMDPTFFQTDVVPNAGVVLMDTHEVGAWLSPLLALGTQGKKGIHTELNIAMDVDVLPVLLLLPSVGIGLGADF